jgi:hypothetical protein
LSTKLSTQNIEKYFLIPFIFSTITLTNYAQTDSADSNKVYNQLSMSDTLFPYSDSLQIGADTSSLQKSSNGDTAFGLSPNALKSRVDYKATDSIMLEVTTQKVYMFNENDINYEDINLKANYVEIEFKNNTVYATGTPDSSGKETGLPRFTMGNNSFDSKSIKYNYQTKKGLVKNVLTEDAEGYLHGNVVKKMPDDVTNLYQGSYTTCEHEHPHFSFNFKKAKVVPDKKIFTGPAYLVIEDIPTPLVIPFGMFPNKKGQRSGIVIPTYGESTNRGFYFEGGGYYFAISNYLDLKLTGDIYTLGSWAVRPAVNYRKLYKYSGNFNATYAINYLGEEGSQEYQRSRDFSVRWKHSQDTKARPYGNFSADVDIVSRNNPKFNSASINRLLTNTFQSGINYRTNFGGNYFINASLNHTQNTISREVNLTLPNLSFSVNRFYPFRSRLVSGKLKWFENISVNYNMVSANSIDTYDSLLFSEDVTRKMRNGMKHSVSIGGGSVKLLRNILWSNSLNYTERWYSQRHEKNWRSDTLYLNEGPVAGYVGTDTIYGFHTARDFSFSSSLGTTMYGMFALKKGPVVAVRHVMKPSLSFNIRPDFGSQFWGYYKFYITESGQKRKYSIYDGFIYGSPPDGRSGALGFRLSNNLEMKVRSKKDTITGTRKIMLIEDFSLSSSYDFARDSLNLSNLELSGRTTLFKNLQVNYSSTFDPYALDSSGSRINKFEWDVNRKLYRTERHGWRVGLSLSLSSDKLGKAKKSSAGTEQELKDVTEHSEGFVDWTVPWTLNLSYNFTYNIDYRYQNGYWNYVITRDKNIIQSLSINGNVNLTPKWKFGFNTGYDFKNNKLITSSFDIYRDLHCWEMRFTWIPIGFMQSWNFTINIKSSLLQDLKLDKKKDYRDF